MPTKGFAEGGAVQFDGTYFVLAAVFGFATARVYAREQRGDQGHGAARIFRSLRYDGNVGCRGDSA
jgi:hypothetical protein